jgi:hypothetical protein
MKKNCTRLQNAISIVICKIKENGHVDEDEEVCEIRAYLKTTVTQNWKNDRTVTNLIICYDSNLVI